MEYSKQECPHCGQPLEIPTESLGQPLECPACKKQFRLSASAPVTAPAAQPPVSIPSQSSPPDGACPLCGQAKHMQKAKALYGHMVCTKCYYGFANRRQFAFFLDALVWQLFLFPFAFAIGMVMAVSGASQSAIEFAARAIGYLLLPVFICKDCFGGQSLGKLICGVKVIDEETGESGGIGASFKRNLPLMVPFMPLIVGFQLCKGHRTGDGWSRSKVIWKKYAHHPVFAPAQTP